MTAAQLGALTTELDPVANAALVVHTNRIDNPHNVTAVQIGALTVELDPVANAALVVHTNRVDNPHSVTATQIGALTVELDPVAVVHTNRTDNPHAVTAQQIGALTAELDPVAVMHTNRIDNPHSVTAAQIGAIVVELDPVAVVHTNRIDNPHNVTATQIGALTAEADPVAGPRLDLIEPATNKWNAAYSWGDHALVGYLLPANLTPYATATALAVHTNRTDNPHGVTAVQIGAITTELDPVANAKLVIHTNRADNPHGVTAAQLGALTNEQDLAALRTYHYGSPDIMESPAEWFVFDGAGTITAFNWEAGRTNVVIPWAIGGVPVVRLNQFLSSEGNVLVSLIAPKSVATVENSLIECSYLTSVSLPNATTVHGSLKRCDSLTSVSLPNTTILFDSLSFCDALTSVTLSGPPPSINEYTFNESPNVTVYVTNPQATGWGATWNGVTVVRPPLYGSNVTAQAFTLNGDTITEWPAGSSSVPYTAWTGTVTPQNGTATVAYAHGNMPVLVVPNGVGTTYVTVATGTYEATSGVSRVSLSIWAGTKTVVLVTNEVDYATAPDIPTNGWGTILFRRVSNGKWKGVGL